MSTKFIVSPMLEKISLKPGETYKGQIIVANPKDATEDFYYKLDISPYSVIGEDYTPDFETESDWSRIVHWTSLEKTEGVLKPNETEKIGYTIEVPKSAPAGGQYLKIGVTSNAPSNARDGGAVQNVFEMASLVFAEIDGETRREGEIVDSKLPGFVAVGKPTAKVRLSNTGNVHETATTKITVKNIFNGDVISPKDGENNILESIIMPESTREITQALNLPPVGIFEITEEVSFMGETVTPTGVLIICPIWFILLVLGFILSTVGMIFYKKRLHSKKTSAKIEP